MSAMLANPTASITTMAKEFSFSCRWNVRGQCCRQMRLLRQRTAMDVGAGLAPGVVAAFVSFEKTKSGSTGSTDS
jgi:hypothetical protein